MKIKMRERKWSKWWKVPRLLIYLFGIFTVFWFFWNFIGITIGILYFIFFKEFAWKRNGLIMAIVNSSITFTIYFYKGISPLLFAIYTGIGFYFGYFIILLVYEILKWKKVISYESITRRLKRIQKTYSTHSLVFKSILIIIPITLWSVINLDFGVMFDNQARLLWIHGPSKVNIGDSFEITVEAWDAFERLSATYNGRVEFAIESYNTSDYNIISNPNTILPDPYRFTGQLFGSDIAYEIKDGKDNGIHTFVAAINTPGIHYILVNDSFTRETFYSNPIIVKNFTITEKLLVWGDIHSHSELSDGTGTPEHSFYYAENIALLDYNALTDHGEIMLFQPGSLDRLEYTTNAAYEPNRFVTFHGIEWTQTATGHYICIFSGNNLLKDPVLSYLTIPTTDGLWSALDSFTSTYNVRALAIPHHTTKKAYIQDWTYINPKYVKMAEVTSVHGECLFEQRHELNYRGEIDPPDEYTYGSSVMDAFTMGKRMTVYAASDEHDGHPGHSLSHNRAYIGHQRPFSIWHTRDEHPYPGGLTAAFTDNLTREGVFSALYDQTIYGNSDHGRPLLFFSINGTHVGNGSTLVVNNQSSHRLINIFLAQDGAPVASKSTSATIRSNWVPDWSCTIEILKNGLLWQTIDISNPISNVSIIDTEPITGTTFQPYCIEKEGNYYINKFSDNPIDPNVLNTNGFDYYVIRVVGNNGRASYAGPIWVEY